MKRSLIALFMCALSGTIGAAVHAGQPLPYYDIRLDDAGLPRPFVTDAIASSRTVSAMSSEQQEREALMRSIPSLRIDRHEFFDTPHWVASTRGFLTAPPADGNWTPRAVVRRFVADHAALFEFAPVELDAARMSREFRTDHNKATHLTFQQQLGGIDLFGCEALANVTARGELINVSSAMLPRPAGDFPAPAPIITALDAIRSASASIGIRMTVDPTPQSDPIGASKHQVWKNSPDFRPDEPITSELIYFPLTRADIRPAWSVLIPEIGIGNTYEMMVDATNGQILRRWNRLHFATTEPITFRIYTSDSPAPESPGTSTPDGTQAPFVSQQLVTINPDDVSAIDPNGWINDGANQTLGNNVDTHLDLNADNSPDLPRPTGTTYRVFDYPHDPAAAPTTAANRNAAVTQLFYLANEYHDRLWSLGFNEAAKNFQTDNFGRGGTGNDAVQADAQDGSGTNNSNFNTGGADGSTGRCQMYIFTGPTPDRDGDLDADIVFHELSHGLSIRLSNGTVNGTQSGGMGEGWGDYFAVSLNAQPSDNPHAPYPMSGYATYQLWSGYTNNYYFGIRRYPYCTDLNKNPLTFADTDTAQLTYPAGVPRNTNITSAASEVHNVGEIWCNTLLECRASLWDQYGFAGDQRMMQLVVDGLKLEASNPNMLQARDAILQADVTDYSGADLAYLWQAFAKRGMGSTATSPSGSSSSGVVESFVVPILIQFQYPDGIPAQLQPDLPTVFHVNVAPLQGSTTVLTPDTGQLHYAVNGGGYSTAAMTELTPGHYEATLPAATCLAQVSYYVSVGTSDGTVSDPVSAPTSVRLARVFSSQVTVFADDAEADHGWTLGAAGDTATTGQWTRGNPIGTGAQPEDAHSPVNCFFTGQGAVGGAIGDADVDGGLTTLISPTIDVSTASAALVSYWRWFSNDAGSAPNTDTFRVDASGNNGASWTNMETLGATFGGEHSGGWVFHQFDVPAALRTAQFRVRFVADDAVANGGSLVEAAVDDFAVVAISCQPPVTCTRGDVNGDGLVDGADVARFAAILTSGGGTPGEICAGDLAATPNGQIDLSDLDGFVACLLAGGC